MKLGTPTSTNVEAVGGKRVPEKGGKDKTDSCKKPTWGGVEVKKPGQRRSKDRKQEGARDGEKIKGRGLECDKLKTKNRQWKILAKGQCRCGKGLLVGSDLGAA